ncbi:hypothetical protein CHUAL_001454 [Chamberlinius hualienensis]
MFKKNKTKGDDKKNAKNPAAILDSGDSNAQSRLLRSIENDETDLKFGFDRYKDSSERIGWLFNIHPTEILDEEKRLVSAVDFYFVQEDGSRFKVSMPYKPYFYIATKKGCENEVATYLTKKYAGTIFSIDMIKKEDLDLPNHLVGLKRTYLKISFLSVNDLMKLKKDVLPIINKNRAKYKAATIYNEMLQSNLHEGGEKMFSTKTLSDHTQSMLDIREYDVPYHVRVSIDLKIFVAHWYAVRIIGNFNPEIIRRDDIIDWPDITVLAFDIETTKLPLKFPDANIDQIMMISYMIDGQGYLITNREIISKDIESFEYTPKPEFEGVFQVFNEANEMKLLQRFFDHIINVKPNVFVTYNGDMFDWPFIEARAAFHGFNMAKEIGFSRNREDDFSSRPCLHMDCLKWVKRDSYLPIGSQNLKAVAKAKLRYDPVELDPEDMCRLASEQPQVLSSYSVSDAVATYYLYMKYVHPFIFALSTIIPMDPDEVLRKGSGTLCEALLMVEAFHANVIFPNKQESVLNKMTDDGHVLDQETYVGGHVEALESGVFRADIAYRFRTAPEMFQRLIDNVPKTLEHAIVEEEGVPLSDALNFDEVCKEIETKLIALRDCPARIEKPLIYHLDVGAMYPNIILTNRLQPYATVNDVNCAACDFNKPGATCQRTMTWTWRGEFMPATRGEFQRIKQQLETDKFPPAVPGGNSRAFHQLNKEDRAAAEKKRLADYCRKAYKKIHVTRIEEREQTICQKENSFYVDTVRAFRDRRYQFKAQHKVAKANVAAAIARNDAADIKSAKNKEVLYDSLQLAHKCILNSFYGYVMRKGARWYSMEMAGIVCHTGANIITKAREIIEKIGRPLELDTDGIWCMLPGSFPENVVVRTQHSKKSKIVISYPGAMLNHMIKEHFTNHQYHELVDPNTLTYVQRSENSIFFEVDGPYLGMVLPASKEEGKKIKKRYAVFNFDGSLAELKGFEIKRRGELQLVKIFQSSVFEAFLRGVTLDECYAAVAKVADYWLDVLYSKAENMPDSELFELIAENRSMSKKLEDYGQQKSTSIKTAQRLAEFLGDQMVKDAGLSCRFIISRKPEGAPVTDRAIPLAIFQTEPSVCRHYLKKWLKLPTADDIDIRDVLDWNYYIERLGNAIQKIITIPASLQGVANPVPRIAHPGWLHKKLLDKTDVLRQKRINEIFSVKHIEKNDIVTTDIEDIVKLSVPKPTMPVSSKRKRVTNLNKNDKSRLDLSWREALGPPPSKGTTKESFQRWLVYQKKKWTFQRENRKIGNESSGTIYSNGPSTSVGQFLRRTQQTLLNSPWQIIQIAETAHPGLFHLWALVGNDVHLIKLSVPRIFYINQRSLKPEATGDVWKKVNRILPRSHPMFNLYQYTLPEDVYMDHKNDLLTDLATPNIEGIYEAQVPLYFRALVDLGCVCMVAKQFASKLSAKEMENFDLEYLEFKSLVQNSYLLPGSLKYIYFYHYSSGQKAMYGLFFPTMKKAYMVVFDSVKSNQMPNMTALLNKERNKKITGGTDIKSLPEGDYNFEVSFETDKKNVYRKLQKYIQNYKDEKKGATAIAIHSSLDYWQIVNVMPTFGDFPIITVHSTKYKNYFNVLDWQRVGAKLMFQEFLTTDSKLMVMTEQSRYFHIPVGNMPNDATLFGADLFLARHLKKHNNVWWCSTTDRPDLGGKEADDNRLFAEFEDNVGIEINNPGAYNSVCVELDIESLAVNALLMSNQIHELEGTSSSVAFNALPQVSLEDMIGGVGPATSLASYDETALCSGSFKILRTMVQSWLREVSHFRNVFADSQMIHFYRWLRSSQSLFYEPALRKILHSLMKKLFMQLVAEFQQFGSEVVYASFNRIILNTKKHRVMDALAYTEFIVNKIRNKDLFQAIDITFKSCWEYLLWIDPANYGGIKGALPNETAGEKHANDHSDDEPETNEENNELDDSEDGDKTTIEMNWNLIQHISKIGNCCESFSDIIANYIYTVFNKTYEEYCAWTPGSTPVLRKRSSQSQIVNIDPNDANAKVESYINKYLRDELTEKLFLFVQKTHNKWPKVTDFTGIFNSSSIANNYSINPALELVKAMCKILSLDPFISEQVIKLRRDLLRLIGIGEFSPESTWKDPCLSYILPEVICQECNHCRDLDLCRDAINFHDAGEGLFWQCPMCQEKYQTSEIQALMITCIHKKSMSHTLQDLKCMRCQQIKFDHMSTRCQCGGSYANVQSNTEFSQMLTIFSNIAEKADMPVLEEVVGWLRRMNPSM